MKPCQIRQTLRPPRLGVITPYNEEKIISYIKLLSASAGGIYNFILPFKNQKDFEKWEKYLRPGLQDYLFYDEEIEKEAKVKWREWPDYDKRLVIEYKDYPESYLSFLDVSPFYQEWESMPEKAKKQRELIYLERIDNQFLFPLFLFGALPENLTFPFLKNWQHMGAESYQFTWEDYLNPFDKSNKIGPLQFSGFFLNTKGNLEPHGIIYIGNPSTIDDLLEFWNLRALGHKIIFLPQHLIEEEYLDLKKWDHLFTPQYRYDNPDLKDYHRPNIVFGSTVCKDSEDWNSIISKVKERIGRAIRIVEPVFEYNHSYLYPRARFVYFSEEKVNGYESDKEMKSISRPPFSNYEIPHSQKWLINFSMGSFFDTEIYPSELPELDIESEQKLFNDSYYRSEHAHLSRNEITVVGQSYKNEYLLPKISVLQIISAIADSKGYEVNLSKPGHNVTLILKGLGSLQFDGRILKIKGVRDVITFANRDRFVEADLEEILNENPPDDNRLISSGSLEIDSLKNYLKILLSRYHEKIANEEFTGIKNNKALNLIKNGMEDTKGICIAPHKQADSQQFILEQMLAQNILELGFNFECVRKHSCWYGMDKLSEAIECRICGEKTKIINPKKNIDWAYQTKGMFRLKNDGDGSVSVIVTLWRLLHSFRGATFTSSVEVKKKRSKGTNFEVDYIVHLENWREDEPKIILGESKSLNSLGERDMNTMSRALKVFSALRPAVCFSTLKENFSDNEILLIKDFRKKHPFIEILTFVRKQLDVYDLRECEIEYHDLKHIASQLYKINIGDKYWLDFEEIQINTDQEV